MKLKLLAVFLLSGICAAQNPKIGTITGTGSVCISTTNQGTVGISITGSWSGTIQPTLSIGGDPAQNTAVTPYSSTTPQATITGNGTYQAFVSGSSLFCLTGATVTNTANVKMQAATQSAGSKGGGGGGSGTVTSVATGTGLTGGPISGTGTISLVTPVTAGNGGTGIANTATFKLGSANVDLSTIGTGILKVTTSTGALTDAASSDVIGLFTGCSGTLVLQADGTCGAAGTGTVTSIDGSNGLTGGPITGSGTLAIGGALESYPNAVTVSGTNNIYTGNDMCEAIETAIANNGSGHTYNAEGFTGNQVCLQSRSYGNTTVMLYGGAAIGTEVDGKLLLSSSLNWYIDGPTGSWFTDGVSNFGTPAVIVPWGFKIEYQSKIGHFVTPCSGSNTPVSGCTHAFPVRSFSISSTSLSGNNLTLNTSGIVNAGGPASSQNMYVREVGALVSPSCSTNNLLRAVATIPNSSTLTIKAPSTTANCANTATFYLGTAIFGFGGQGSGSGYTPIAFGTSQGFGAQLINVNVDLATTLGAIAVQNITEGEQSGIRGSYCRHPAFGCYVVGYGANESGPYDDLYVQTLTTTTNVNRTTFGLWNAAAGRGFRGFTETINSSLNGTSAEPTAAIYNAGSAIEFTGEPHSEGTIDLIDVGTDPGLGGSTSMGGIFVRGSISGPSTNANVNQVHIVNDGISVVGSCFQGILQQVAGNAILDDINNQTITDTGLGSYCLNSNGVPVAQTANGVSTSTYTMVGATSGSASIKAANTAGTPSTWVMPTTDPTSGQVLAAATPSGGSVQLSWTPAGTGNTTSTSLTTGSIPKASGTNSIVNSAADDGITTANTFTYSGSGGISASAGPLQALSDGTHTGGFYVVGNTTNPTYVGSVSNVFGWLAPNSATFTSYWFQPSATAPSAAGPMLVGATSSNVSAVTYGTLSGNTTKFLTFGAGSITLGDCFKADANGNAIDCGGAAVFGSAYQTAASNGSTVAQRSTINFIQGSNQTVSCVDNAGASRTDCTFSASSSAGSRLDQISAATGANTANNADNAQVWNWSLTTASKTGFTFGENVASVATGTPVILGVSTLTGSTANPFAVTAQGTSNGILIDTNGIVRQIGTGGFGAGTTAHGVLISEGTSSRAVATAVGTNGQLLIGQSAADPTWNTMSQDCTISSAGVMTCTKTNNVAFGTMATGNFATPSAIGGTTPAAGTFTTLVANTSLSVNGGTALTSENGTDVKIQTGTGSFTASNMACGDANGGVTPCTTTPSGMVLGNGVTGTTQSAGDNSTKVATTAYVDRVPKTRAIVFNFGAPEGSALSTNLVRYVTVPFACTIAGWDISADSGTATMKFWKVATGTALPTVSNNISTSGVQLTTGTTVRSSTVSDFTTTTVTAGDIIAATNTATSAAKFLQTELECATQ